MFRRFAGSLPDGALELFRMHPSELLALLEIAWSLRRNDSTSELGDPRRRSNLPPVPGYLLNLFPNTAINRGRFGAGGDDVSRDLVQWDHLIYAYLIENTRTYDVFRRVVEELVHGEKLGIATPEAQHWLRNTEAMFFHDPPQFAITSVFGHVRPHLAPSRLNAYHRMFALSLNHPAPDGTPVAYRKAEAANVEFVPVLEEFLREVWVGIANLNNHSGANPTDDAAVAELARRLHDMLRARRLHGNLSREEFAFVSTMAWFHLTLEFNSPIVVDLRAEAASPEQRLFKISERVGLPAHAKSRNFFELADPLSRILVQIEQGTYNEPSAVPALYGPGPGDDMRKIIMHWSESTGHNLKSRRVDVVPNAS